MTSTEVMFLTLIIPQAIIMLPFTIGSLFSKRIADIIFVDNIIHSICLTIAVFLPFFNMACMLLVLCEHLSLNRSDVNKFINRFSPEHLKIRN